MPHKEDRRKIWQDMLIQFSLNIDGKIINEQVDIFPDVTVRDIKGLTKLVAKFCQQKAMLPELEVFKRCSIFRGMKIVTADVK